MPDDEDMTTRPSARKDHDPSKPMASSESKRQPDPPPTDSPDHASDDPSQ